MWLERCSDKVRGIARKLVEGAAPHRRGTGLPALVAREKWYPYAPLREQDALLPGHEVQLPPLRMTVYKTICMVLGRSATPLHEKEICRLVAEAYPPLAQSIKKFNRQVHSTLSKGRKPGSLKE